MNTMRYKLVAADVDGTLIDDNGQISEYTARTIKKAIDNGLLFTIATGRSLSSITHFINGFGISCPLIISNGARIVAPGGEVLFSCDMKPEPAMKIWRTGIEANTTIILWSGNRLYSNKADGDVEEYRRKNNNIDLRVVKGSDISHLAAEGVTKQLFIDTPERLAELMSGVCTELPDTISFFKSSPVYLEFVDSSVSKGAALERLGNMLEIPRSEIAAFGDADNDIQMIRNAGLGVAMANSSEKLLREANYVTRSNNEDGIAVVLEKIIKGEEII